MAQYTGSRAPRLRRLARRFRFGRSEVRRGTRFGSRLGKSSSQRALGYRQLTSDSPRFAISSLPVLQLDLVVFTVFEPAVVDVYAKLLSEYFPPPPEPSAGLEAGDD